MSFDDLIETSVPRTVHGNEYDEWAKLLDFVEDDARNGYGFSGDWYERGGVIDVMDGAVLLECAGYRTQRDKDAKRGKLHVLWQFRGTSWVELARSEERDWALKLRVPATRALEASDEV